MRCGALQVRKVTSAFAPRRYDVGRLANVLPLDPLRISPLRACRISEHGQWLWSIVRKNHVILKVVPIERLRAAG